MGWSFLIPTWSGWNCHEKKVNLLVAQLCPAFCDPIDSSPPGSAVLGFSRQECWSGLPFPSPMHESESEVTPMDLSPPGFFFHGILQARILEWVATGFSKGSSQPKDRTQVSCIAGRFFTRAIGVFLILHGQTRTIMVQWKTQDTKRQ